MISNNNTTKTDRVDQSPSSSESLLVDPTVASDPKTYTASNPVQAAREDAEVRAHQGDTDPRSMRVIWLLIVTTFVAFLNETVMGVAIPHLVVDLGIDLNAGQWLTAAFMLTMAVVIPVTGFLLQRFPTRPVYLTSVSLFSLGTLLAALAPGFTVLLVARIIQASGTAILMPLMMTTIMTLVAPANRGRIMGRVSIVLSVAPAFGPTLGGLIITNYPWRFLFWFVLPVALTMLVIGLRVVSNVSVTRKSTIDSISVVLSALGFGGLIYGLSLIGDVIGLQVNNEDATGKIVTMIVSLVVGALSLVVFILRQVNLQREDRALLDLRTFHSRNFSISLGLMAVMMAALFGTLILIPIYLQNVLHLDAFQSGFLILPGGVLMGILGPIVGRLFDKFGPTRLVVPGAVVVSAVLWFFTTSLTSTTSWVAVLVAHILMSLGMAFMFTPLFTCALGSVEPRFYSHGSAIVGTLQQVSGAAGTALFIAVLTSRAAEYLSTSSGKSSASQIIESQASGITAAFLVGAILSLLSIVGAFLIRKPADMQGAPAGGGH